VRIGGELVAADGEGWVEIPAGARKPIELRIPGPGELGKMQASFQ
jgi:hypothetical protein